jgi:hypothetical protein
LEAFPHIEYWREAPSLIRDGISFCFSKLKGTSFESSSKEEYETV